MKLSLAYLGPTGTNSETAALAYADWLSNHQQINITLNPYPSIAVAMQSVIEGKVDRAVVPIENSIEGSVTVVLDALWQSANLHVQQELTIPIAHGLLSYAKSLAEIKTVYSHPQGLAQCQIWLASHLPQAQLVTTKSTTDGIKYLQDDLSAAAVSAPRAAQLYQVPLLQLDIKDSPDNCTRFWIVSSEVSDMPSGQGVSPDRAGHMPQCLAPRDMNALHSQTTGDAEVSRATLRGTHLSLAFSLPRNAPGALVNALAIFADRNINLSKIESRPTKRSLGEYIFFIDLEGNSDDGKIKEALQDLSRCTEVLKIFGNYSLLPISS